MSLKTNSWWSLSLEIWEMTGRYRQLIWLFVEFVNNLNMGALCSGNIFNELQDKHGAEFVKLMVAENSKDLVQSHFEGLYNSSDAMFKNVHGNINGQY